MLITPNLKILPPPQYVLWPELSTTPKSFVLYGGTAIALRLGHRQSIDFDFFSAEPFVPADLLNAIPYLQNATPLMSQNNSLVCSIDRDGPIKLSFFGGLSFGHIQLPDVSADNQIQIASLLDLTASKLKVIQDRAEYKDYFDLFTLLKIETLDRGLSAAQAIYGPSFNPLLSLKALTFFDDGDLKSLSDETKSFLTHQVHQINLKNLPSLTAQKGLL